MAKSIATAAARKSKRRKPAKPHADFPLFPHATGRWAKKVRGKFVYFGAWAEPDKALELWLAQKDDLLAGRTPRTTTAEGLTVDELVNRFLDEKRHLVDTRELAARTWGDYRTACARVKVVFESRKKTPRLLAARRFGRGDRSIRDSLKDSRRTGGLVRRKAGASAARERRSALAQNNNGRLGLNSTGSSRPVPSFSRIAAISTSEWPSRRGRGNRFQGTGDRRTVVGSGQWAGGSGQGAVGRRQSASTAGRRQEAVGRRQWAVGRRQWAGGSRQ